MKLLLTCILLITFSTSIHAQSWIGGGSVGPKPTDDTRTTREILLNSIRDRNNIPKPDTLNSWTGGTIGPRPVNDSLLSTNNGGGGFGGGVSPRPATNSDLGALAGQVTQDQIRAFKTEVDAFNARTANKGDEEVLPTRLHIESINLSSDEVTEITLKDGSVVKVEDLQEFVRQKMKEKLNQ